VLYSHIVSLSLASSLNSVVCIIPTYALGNSVTLELDVRLRKGTYYATGVSVTALAEIVGSYGLRQQYIKGYRLKLRILLTE
jgi:hypothetical protein